MTIHTISSRELNQDLARAKRAALDGPVSITDRGRPAHVLMSFAQYQKMIGQRRNILGRPTALAITEYLLLSNRTRQVLDTAAGTEWKPSKRPA